MFRSLSLEALGLSATQSELNELALSNGFKGFELPILEFAERVKLQGLPHARRLIDSAKLRVSSFRLPVDWTGDDDKYRQDMARLPELLEIATAMGCTRATTALEPASDVRHYHANFEFCRQRLGELAKALEPANVRLAVGIRSAAPLRAGKSFEFIYKFDQLLMLLGMVTAKNLGVVFDTWELTVAGHDLAVMAQKAGNLVSVVDIAGVPADAPLDKLAADQRTLPTEAELADVAAAVAVLAKAGYDGPITATPSPSLLTEKNRAGMVRQCGQTLGQLWKAAGLSPAGKLVATS